MSTRKRSASVSSAQLKKENSKKVKTEKVPFDFDVLRNKSYNKCRICVQDRISKLENDLQRWKRVQEIIGDDKAFEEGDIMWYLCSGVRGTFLMSPTQGTITWVKGITDLFRHALLKNDRSLALADGKYPGIGVSFAQFALRKKLSDFGASRERVEQLMDQMKYNKDVRLQNTFEIIDIILKTFKEEFKSISAALFDE